MPESPRWLEAKGHADQARKIVERMEKRVMKRHPVLPEPDLSPHQVVVQERTSVFAVLGKQYWVRTVFILVLMALVYGGIVYGNAGYEFLFLVESRGFGAGALFALISWAGLSQAGLNAIFAVIGDRIERRSAALVLASLFAGCWYALYNVHGTVAVSILFVAAFTCAGVFLNQLYAYIPENFPTRMRSLGTGWTDGAGHMGAWAGVVLTGVVFAAASPLGWILLITIPGALVPGLMIRIFGQRQRNRVLEELAR
jgi:putative MFS transporter